MHVYTYVYTTYIHMWAVIFLFIYRICGMCVPCKWRHTFCRAARFHFGISILFPYLTRAPSLHIFCRKPSIDACIAFLSKPVRDSAPAQGADGGGMWAGSGDLLKI